MVILLLVAFGVTACGRIASDDVGAQALPAPSFTMASAGDCPLVRDITRPIELVPAGPFVPDSPAAAWLCRYPAARLHTDGRDAVRRPSRSESLSQPDDLVSFLNGLPELDAGLGALACNLGGMPSFVIVLRYESPDGDASRDVDVEVDCRLVRNDQRMRRLTSLDDIFAFWT